jgi:DNA-directed RNA polymerase beta' subunit
MAKKKKFTKLLSVQIGLASPKKMRNWGERILPNGKKVGQVTNSQTVNYKTLRPERDGLFCERIFGPLKDYECSCGRKPLNAQEGYCPDCEIEYTTSNVRRYRLGYIKLVSPVAHIWYLKGIPSYLSLFLNMKRKEVEAIVYCTENISMSSLIALKNKQTSSVTKILGVPNPLSSEWNTSSVTTKESDNSVMTNKTGNFSFSSTVYRKFPWEFQDDWNIFRFFISAPASANDEVIPFYKNQAENTVHNLYVDRALTGAEAVKSLLSSIDLSLLDQQISSEIYEMSEEIDELDLQRFLYAWEERRLGFLLKSRQKKIRRLKLVRQFRRTQTRPEWMILSVLPVLPPDLRPILQMDNDQVAVSDLNKLYQKVLFRNNRMERHLAENLSFPKSDELRYAQRLLQESVDSLLENGKGGSTPITAANDRPLKSLSDLLKGKKGRFRQNLLGKRVDYSGRSVIVVGPSLKLHQCGLPREMAIELFQPFLIRALLATKTVRTILGAKHLIQKRNPIIWSCLYQILKNHPILLNRAPTLHRLGFQAFQPKLVPGRAILLHPLVCPAFNADFDGDQMAVHVPLSYEARAESWKLMWSRNNILAPATGEPILLPSQDMVLGCYYLTTISQQKQKDERNKLLQNKLMSVEGNTSLDKLEKSSFVYSNINLVFQKYLCGLLKPHDTVWVKLDETFENDFNETKPLEIRVNKNGRSMYLFNEFLENYSQDKQLTTRYIRTTVGRIVFNKMILAKV